MSAAPRKRVLELSGGVGSLPQAPRWNADRRARPSLPPRTQEREERSGRAAASADADGRFTRLSAFRLPDFFKPGVIEMDARYHRRRRPTGLGPELFVFRGAKLGRSAPRERFCLVIASASGQSSSVRRGACHRAGHFRPDPLAPRNAGRRCAARGRRFTRSRRRSAIRARHRASMSSDLRWLDNLSDGAGDGIRTHDPNLGKVVLYP
jgi:hypothetical protein